MDFDVNNLGIINKKALRDFETYAGGIKRLRELEKELNSLDTSKFRSEEREIRTKLKNVHLIPEIEYDLRKLRERISGINVPYRKSKFSFLREKFNKLSPSFERKSENISRDLLDIGVIENRIDFLKKKLEKKSAEIEQELNNKNNVSKKEGLFSEINELKQKLENYKSDLYQKVDKGISDSKWNYEKERELMREELKDISSETKWLIDKESKEIYENLISEIKNFEQRILERENENYNKIMSRIAKTKAEIFSDLEQEEKTIRNELINRDIKIVGGVKEFVQPFLHPVEKEESVLSLRLPEQEKFEEKKIEGEMSLPNLPSPITTDVKEVLSSLKKPLNNLGLKSEGKIEIPEKKIIEPINQNRYADKIKSAIESPMAIIEDIEQESEKELSPIIHKKSYLGVLKEAEEELEEDFEKKILPTIEKIPKFIKGKLYLGIEELKKGEEALMHMFYGAHNIHTDINQHIEIRKMEKERISSLLDDMEKTKEELGKIRLGVLKNA